MICSWFQMKLQSWCILLWKLVVDFVCLSFPHWWDTFLFNIFPTPPQKINLQTFYDYMAFLARLWENLVEAGGLRFLMFSVVMTYNRNRVVTGFAGLILLYVKNFKQYVN